MWTKAATLDYKEALQTKQGAEAITLWLLSRCNRLRLPQFRVAKELAGKQQETRHPLTPWWWSDREKHYTNLKNLLYKRHVGKARQAEQQAEKQLAL